MAATKPPSVELKHIFGLKASVSNNIHYVNDHTIAYPAGHSVVLYNMETRQQEFRHCSPDVEEITAMAITPNKRVLAVAERGERAYVSFFETGRNHKRSRGLAMPAESTANEFSCVAFSGDGKLCLTQGAAPEWLLTLWHWDKAKPIVSVKTSPDPARAVYQVSFNPSDPSIVCATGNGICKFYRVADSFFKPITNSMSKREPQNYLCHAWLPEERVLVGTDTGDILLFEHYELKCVLPSSPSDGNSIDSFCVFAKGFFIGCEEGVVTLYEPSDDRVELYKATKSFPVRGNLARVTNMIPSPGEDTMLLSLDNHQMYALPLTNVDLLDSGDNNFDVVPCAWHGPGSSGRAVVTGVDTCLRKPLIATCGLDRTIRIWNYQERAVELVKQFEEEAYAVALHPSGLHAAVGFADKVRFLNLLMDDIRSYKEFSIKGCRELRFSHGGQFLAVANGQFVVVYDFFRCTQYASLQQLNTKITALAWSKNDRYLFSAGLGGSIFKWDVSAKEKATDYVNRSFNWSSISVNDDGTLLYAIGSPPVLPGAAQPAGAARGGGSGCTVVEIEFPHGQRSLDQHKKQLDPGVFANQVTLAHSGKLFFVGSGQADSPGLIRAYRAPIVSGDCAETIVHYGGVARMALTADDQHLFSVGEDGLVALLEVKDPERPMAADAEGGLPFAEEILVTRAALEEDALKAAELKAEVEKLRQNNEYQITLKESNFKDEMDQVTERFAKQLAESKREYARLKEEKDAMVQENQKRVELLARRHEQEGAEMTETYDQKIQAEIERYDALEAERDMLQQQWEQRNKELEAAHERYLRDLEEDYTAKLEDERRQREKLAKEKSESEHGFNDMKTRVDDDANVEISTLKQRYEERLDQEHRVTLKLKGENGLMKKRFDALRKDIAAQREEIKTLQMKEKNRYEQIKNLEKDIQGHKKEIREREDTINDKDKRIYDLRKKNQELEKFKFVLQYKIKELDRQIKPKESEIEDLRQQIKEMDAEMQQYHKSNAALDLMIGELRLKMAGLQEELDRQGSALGANQALIKRFRADLHETVQSIANYKKLKEGIVALYRTYVQETGGDASASASASGAASAGSSADAQREYARQREYLEKSVESLKRKIAKDVEMHRTDHMRLMRENVVLTKEINNLRREIQGMRANHARVQYGGVPGASLPPKPPTGSRGGSSMHSRASRLRSGRLSEAAAQRELEIQRQQIEHLELHLRRLEEQGPGSARGAVPGSTLGDSRVEPAL